MQTGSVNLAQALTGGLVTWGKPLVYADWAQDGYGATGSIDDLSDQIGRPIEITHYLDDGLPNEVTFAAGLGTPELSVALAGGDYVSGTYLTAAQYFSPFRTDSPVYNYQRDVAPVKVEAQAVTSAGLETVRVFTGRMIATPTDGQSASLIAISANRLKLAKLVQLPVRAYADPFLSKYYGLTAAWAVTFAMHQCGVYPSPPAVSGCRYWAPLHGGGHTYLPSSNILADIAPFLGYVSTDGTQVPTVPETIHGPYVGGMMGRVGSTYQFVRTDVAEGSMLDGTDWLTRDANRGRFEFWLRGDSTSVNSVPGGSAEVSVGLAELFAGAPKIMAGFDWNYNDTIYLVAGIRSTDKHPIISLNDGSTTSTSTLSDPVPTDGLWHFYGFAWDVLAKKTWFNVDGTVTASNISSASSAGLPTDQWGDVSSLNFGSGLPVSEVQFSAGGTANHDANPTWSYNSNWTRGASASPSILDLVALCEPPREAWELIGRYAQAELAQFRADENDTILYLPLPYWAHTARQTTLQTLSARRDSKPPKVSYDPSKIRNSVRLNYSQTALDSGRQNLPVLEINTPLPVPPGVTRYLVALDIPAYRIFFPSLEIPVLTEDQIDGTDPNLPLTGVPHYVSYNTSPDGTGTYPTVTDDFAADLHAYIEDWEADQILLKFVNTTGVTYYVVNNSSTFSVDLAFLSIGGYPIYINTRAFVTSNETDSVSARGERALPLQIDLIQSEVMAQQMADILVGDLAYPVPVIERLELFGDPRRQPGDLISYSDPDGTGVSGLWRFRGIKHTIDAGGYTQLTTLRRARQVGAWDSGLWNDCIWGE